MLIGIIFLLFNSSRFKGYRGERKVKRKLESIARNNNEYLPFHNLTLKTPDGSTQIDHLLISPFGIFVIETKNLKGWIFGGTNQKRWTQSLYGENYKFQNPLHQNYKHVKAVQSLLDVELNTILSIVVFVGKSDFQTDMPENVIELHELIPYLKSIKKQILSSEDIENFSQKIRTAIHEDSVTTSDHISNIYQNKENPVCPRCGKPMILRTANKGRSAGSQFWGCSGFPACKATKDAG